MGKCNRVCVSSRIMWVRMKVAGEKVVVVGVYGPGMERNENEREVFWESLNECLSGFSENETGSRSPCMRPRSDPPKMKNSTPDKIVAKKKKKNNEANWMVSNSAKLDHRTKQHTQFGVSASNGSRDMARTKSWQKKTKKKKTSELDGKQ